MVASWVDEGKRLLIAANDVITKFSSQMSNRYKWGGIPGKDVDFELCLRCVIGSENSTKWSKINLHPTSLAHFSFCHYHLLGKINSIKIVKTSKQWFNKRPASTAQTIVRQLPRPSKGRKLCCIFVATAHRVQTSPNTCRTYIERPETEKAASWWAINLSRNRLLPWTLASLPQ